MLALSYGLLVFPVVFLARGGTSEAEDQQRYDAPFIERLAAEWPHLDLVSTHGLAMTPGYHVTMAAIRHFADAGVLALRIVTAVLGFPLVFVVFWFCGRWTEPRTAFLLTLPLTLSSYVLGSAIWLRSDNVALCCVALVVGIGALSWTPPLRILVLGALSALATAVRQINVWTIVPILWSGLVDVLPAMPWERTPAGAGDRRHALGPILATLGAVVAPLAVLGYFFWLWGGLVPPQVAEADSPGAPGLTMVPVTLALTGFFGAFFAAAVAGQSSLALLRDWRVVAASLGTLLIAVLPRTEGAEGPRGFLVVLQETPILLGRVVALLPFSALAGAALSILVLAAIRAGRTRPAVFLLLAYGTWAVAMTANLYPMRRYCEPFLLLLFSWLTALGLPSGGQGRVFASSLLSLVALQCALSALKIYLPAFVGP